MALRLAEGTPWILLDLLCLTVFAFLLSRLWATAAPRLGRLMGRWLLALALPIGLVVSISAHVAAPGKARSLTEALDSTAFFASIPLGLWWLGAVAVYWIRRLVGHPRAKDAAPQPTEWLRLALVTVPVACVVILVQWDASRDETRALATRAYELEKIARVLDVVDRKAEEFARDRGLRSEKLEALRRVVPREPSTQEFIATLRALTAEYGLRITGWTEATPRPEGVLQEHALTLSVEGDVRNLGALAKRTEKMARLSVWYRALVSDGKTRVEVAVYSAPDPPTRRRADACAHPVSSVWLWPYTVKVAAGRRQVDQRCRDVARFASVQDQVDEYQAKKARLEALVVAVEKTMARRRTLEIVMEEPGKRAVAAAPEA